MKPERIIIVGTGRLPCACLEACLAGLVPVAGVVESGDHAFSPLAALCQRRKVKYTLMLDREQLSQLFLSINQPTLVVSAYNYFIFPQRVLDNRTLNVVNFHNSLIPRHRGRNAPTWSIYEMDAITGITWHQVHPVVDMGDVITQRKIEIGRDTTALDLTLETLTVAAQAFQEILPSLLDGSYARTPVKKNGEESYHRSTDVPNGGVLDLGWSLDRAHAFLRALDYGKFAVFAPPKAHFLGMDLAITNYRIQRNSPNGSGKPSLTFRDNQLVLRSEDVELSITCG